jgi:hypothetical protein
MAMGNTSSRMHNPIIKTIIKSVIYLWNTEETTLDTAGHTPAKWLRFYNDALVV